MSEKDIKEFLDLNKIIYSKAERLTSQKDGRALQMFKLEIKDEAEAEARILQNLTCHITCMIYNVEEFRSPVSVQQCWNCHNFGHSQSKCTNCKGPRIASYKGCPAYKKQAFGQHVVDNRKSYAAILLQNTAPPQPQDKTFTFSAKQLLRFVANVAIQVAQPQVCYINSPRTQLTRSQVCVKFQTLPKHT